MQEEREKAGEGRLERNKRWRQRKETHHSSSSSSTTSTSSSLKELVDNQEEVEKQSRRRETSERRQDEKESRREKNREWRRKRSKVWDETSGGKKAENQSKLCEILQAVLACSDCGLVSLNFSFHFCHWFDFKELGTTSCRGSHVLCESCPTEVGGSP